MRGFAFFIYHFFFFSSYSFLHMAVSLASFYPLLFFLSFLLKL